MATRTFIGYDKVTGEKVYVVEVGMTTQYQTQSGRQVSSNSVIPKDIPQTTSEGKTDEENLSGDA